MEATSKISPVILGESGYYAVLSKAGITADTPKIAGNVGTGPAGAAVLAGFDQILSSDGCYSTSPFVTGNVFAGEQRWPI